MLKQPAGAFHPKGFPTIAPVHVCTMPFHCLGSVKLLMATRNPAVPPVDMVLYQKWPYLKGTTFSKPSFWVSRYPGIHVSFGGCKYPTIYRVLAPSKRWLALGFLNHSFGNGFWTMPMGEAIFFQVNISKSFQKLICCWTNEWSLRVGNEAKIRKHE